MSHVKKRSIYTSKQAHIYTIRGRYLYQKKPIFIALGFCFGEIVCTDRRQKWQSRMYMYMNIHTYRCAHEWIILHVSLSESCHTCQRVVCIYMYMYMYIYIYTYRCTYEWIILHVSLSPSRATHVKESMHWLTVSCACATWLNVRDVTHVWELPYERTHHRETVFKKYFLTDSCVTHDWFVCVTWLICVCDMTALCVWHASLMSVTW